MYIVCTTLYILSKLITLVGVPINYHNVPVYLILSANGINTICVQRQPSSLSVYVVTLIGPLEHISRVTGC